MSERPTIILGHYDSEVLSDWRSDLEGGGYRVQATSSGADVLKRVESQNPDAVVIEPLLPRRNGLSVLKEIKAGPAGSRIAVIMVLDEGDTYTENRALIGGADAIVRRSAEGVLPDGALAGKLQSLLGDTSAVNEAEAKEQAAELRNLIEDAAQSLRDDNPVLSHITDGLTGLFNGGYLAIKLSEEFKRARRFGEPLSIVELQLRRQDGEENDGDAAWRHVLNEVAGLLLCESRDIDVLAREDAATFCLLLPHTGSDGAIAMIERILGDITERTFGSERREAVSAAAGVVEYRDENAESGDELRRRADEALRQAWSTGGGCHVLWKAETP